MTIHEIQVRLDKLLADIEQAKATLYRLDGAAQDCRYWLERLSAQPHPAPPPPEGSV